MEPDGFNNPSNTNHDDKQIRPISNLPVDDAFDYTGYDFEQDNDNSNNRNSILQTPKNRIENEGNHIKRTSPPRSNLLQPNNNNNDIQRNVSFSQKNSKRISFAANNNDTSPTSYSSTSPKITEEVENFDNEEVLARHASVMKRHRWGTQRHKKGRPPKRSRSLFKSKRLSSGSKASDNNNNASNEDLSNFENTNQQQQSRKIYVNMPLPNDMVDPDTGLPITDYPRNKIRTTKYTPLSFVPKNLFYQFQNVANIYFLFVAILGVSCVKYVLCYYSFLLTRF